LLKTLATDAKSLADNASTDLIKAAVSQKAKNAVDMALSAADAAKAAMAASSNKITAFAAAAATIAANIEAKAAARQPRSDRKAAAAESGEITADMAYGVPPATAVISLPAFSRCVNGYSVTGTGQGGGVPTMSQGTQTFTSMERDPYYLKGPTCVICNDPTQADKNGINRNLSGGWLHWRALPTASASRKPDNYESGDNYLGVHGHYEFFVARGQEMKVPKFAIFIMAAATQSDTAAGGAGGGAGGGASGGSAGTATAGRSFPIVFSDGTTGQILP
jgi:hypothetical protein